MERRDERDLTWLAELLVKAGQAVIPTLGPRLRSAPPHIRRTLLGVFDRLEVWPEAEELRELCRHEDTPLRREAVRLMLKHDALREEAIETGLRDPDERIVGLALSTAVRACTPRVAAALIRRLQEDDVLSSELRSRGIRALSGSNLEEGMRWMVSRVLTQQWLFRYTKLRRVTPELVACVAGLATHWSDHAETALALLLARRSRDRDVRTAARARPAA
jgi:hypothetical protein